MSNLGQVHGLVLEDLYDDQAADTHVCNYGLRRPRGLSFHWFLIAVSRD